MKTILIITLSISATLFSSCRKTYKCSCTTTLNQPGYYPYQTVSVENIDKKTTKKKATAVCENTEKQMQANTSLVFNQDVTVSTKCVLVDTNR